MTKRMKVEDAANPLSKLAIEPLLKLERTLSFGWIRGGKRGLGAMRFDIINNGARALNDAPGILEHRYESASAPCA